MPNGHKEITLTLQQALKVLGSQVVQLVKSSLDWTILLHDLPKLYLREYGYNLNPELFECNSIREVTEKLLDFVQVSNFLSLP